MLLDNFKVKRGSKNPGFTAIHRQNGQAPLLGNSKIFEPTPASTIYLHKMGTKTLSIIGKDEFFSLRLFQAHK